MSHKKIHADPTKDFFVKMITRDIALEDCIFDLLDNSIDGANRLAINKENAEHLYGFWAEISFDKNHFCIKDNCGGINLNDAVDYAFHFGRRPNAPSDVEGGIGLYGIGMKRAIFKLGRKAEIISNADQCFKVSVDVEAWSAKDDWDFEYEDDSSSLNDKGTKITVTHLNDGIGASFADPIFKNNLIKLIARDYAFFIEKGFSIKVKDVTAPLFKYQMKKGSEISPAFDTYEDEGVKVRIVAGLVDELPDDIPDELTPEKVDQFGWYIICNDRVVLAADKSDKTIWGNDGYKVWHPQYNGFAGFVFFESKDQRKLPWTTTKREVDDANPIYRRALSIMKNITTDFSSYTNRRRADLNAAKEAEKNSTRIDINSIAITQPIKLPTLKKDVDEDKFTNINYRRPKSEIAEIRDHLGSPAMTNREIGNYTFEFFRRMELGK